MNANERQLERCLTKMINAICEVIKRLRPSALSDRTGTSVHLAVDNTNSFTLDVKEEDETRDLVSKLEEIIEQHVPYVTGIHKHYVLNLLHEHGFDSNKLEFHDNLSMDGLILLYRELKSLHDSIEAFQAAWDGKKDAVQEFIKQYPSMKDKPGLWGTTLLYSAAKNGHLELVRYLIEDAKCSVDAQNEQHLEKSLPTTKSCSGNFDITSKAASTALHGSCFNGHLAVVKYLFEHGANYFLQNQSLETPMMNIGHHVAITSYFQANLLLGYSKKLNNLPQTPISEEKRFQIDSIWEYKAVDSQRWNEFSSESSKELQKSLTIMTSDQFKQEICLKVGESICSASIIRFTLSGLKEKDGNAIAWIRCRGSSVLNFDCCALWQIMFTKHPDASTKSIPSLDIFEFPTINNSTFTVQLNCWYNCDQTTNTCLDHAMNIRKKLVKLYLDLISDRHILCNLHAFSFTNEGNSIEGFLRWIPKMVSNTDGDKLKLLDNFSSMAHLNPVPLTTHRLEQITQKTDVNSTKPVADTDDDNIDDSPMSALTNQFDDEGDDDDDDDGNSVENSNKRNGLSDIVLWSPKDDENDDSTISQGDSNYENPDFADDSSSEKRTEQNDDCELEEVNIEDFLSSKNERTDLSMSTKAIEETDSSEKAKLQEEALRSLTEELENIKRVRDEENRKIRQLQESSGKRTKQIEDKLSAALQRIDDMNDKIKKVKDREKEVQMMLASVKEVQYRKIDRSVAHEFLLPKQQLVYNYWNSKVKDLDESLQGRVPKLSYTEENTPTFIVNGTDSHHTLFKSLLKQMLTISTARQKAIEFYHRHLKRIVNSVNRTFFKVRPSTKYWKQFSKILYGLLKIENDAYENKFAKFIADKSIELGEFYMLGDSTSPWAALRNITNNFLNQNQFEDEIERLKHEALDKFIDQNISSQRMKLPKKPTKDSVNTLKHFTDTVKQQFREKKYSGYDLKHLQRIPQLLQNLMIYYYCFTLQLPLYELSEDLLQNIGANTVVALSTATGSGKSTLLPPLLVANGYDKVIVTQPRRLPCKLVSARVNETMTLGTDVNARKLAGWAVSNAKQNPRAKILYLTDGLLKERLLNDTNFIPNNMKVHKGIVFFIDEVHERSVNIDLCLALIARLLATNRDLLTKIKVIISSATLDQSVPRMFREINHVKFREFKVPSMGRLHKVEEKYDPNANIIDVVQKICKHRQRQDQILCFVNSTAEVHQCCSLLDQISEGTIKAYPLVQSQPARIQQEYINNGSIFFSTTVAETSLTFPSLKYVVDTGMINIPIYNIEQKQTCLKEIPAARSTLTQRLGRLGRTQPGQYFGLYDKDAKRPSYPKPHICQSDLISIEFSLRKSPLRCGLQDLEQFLPDKPERNAVKFTETSLETMGILNSKAKLTEYGKLLAEMPDCGSLPMARSVLAALQKYGCGRDLVCIAAFLSVLNTTVILSALPQKFKNPNGDFMALLDIMNEILLIKQSVAAPKFDLKRVCAAHGLSHIEHVIDQALRRYTNLAKSFDLSDRFREAAQIKSNNWELIAKSLLNGYSENVFISKKDLFGRTHHFIRYNDSDSVATLDLKSTLRRPINQAPVSIVLARDILYLSSVRSVAVISFLGAIKPDWLEYKIARQIKLSAKEADILNQNNGYANAVNTFSHAINIDLNNRLLKLSGSSGFVLKAELYLLEQLVIDDKFELTNTKNPKSLEHENLSRNLEVVAKQTRIFNPIIWRWDAENQVKITINYDTVAKKLETSARGREEHVEKVKEEFISFSSWLEQCAVMRHPNSGISPRLLRPQMRMSCEDIERRIEHVTNPKRRIMDLYNYTKGPVSTRETRMEVVAWIAVCKFDCKLEGGFVRDWIVGKYEAKPNTLDKDDWIEEHQNKYGKNIPAMKPNIVPADLDCHLPTHAYFDIEKFQDELHKFDIKCKVFREDWRYVLLLDEGTRTGPFTMDLIEPHVALTHDRIDFDVSNLVLEKNYTRDIGMRIDIQQKPYGIELEAIIDNIKNKRFQILRTIDDYLKRRITKMESRGWKQLGEPLNVLPNPPQKYNAVCVRLHYSSNRYQALSKQMELIPFKKIISMEEIRNPYLEEIYEGMKKVIARQCQGSNPNERVLFHGTNGDGINGILEEGFDDRYFNPDGAWGHGAYFADDPRKSHNYTNPDPGDHTRVMYYNKVLLGKQSIQNDTDNTLVSAPRNYHSVMGTTFTYNEYIVYRFGQALPFIRITYTT